MFFPTWRDFFAAELAAKKFFAANVAPNSESRDTSLCFPSASLCFPLRSFATSASFAVDFGFSLCSSVTSVVEMVFGCGSAIL